MMDNTLIDFNTYKHFILVMFVIGFVISCCVELVVIVFKFCTCELFDMDNGVNYDMLN